MKEAHALSTTNRAASDAKYAEAIRQQIEAAKSSSTSWLDRVLEITNH